MRIKAHYLFAIVILAVYGGEVCPYIESLDLISWLLMLVATYGALYATRPAAVTRWVDARAYEKRVAARFWVELLLYLSGGLFITVFNTAMFHFPPGSGLKILLGFAGLGFFAALDLALEEEREVNRELWESGVDLVPSGEMFPLTRRFLFVSVSTMALIMGVVFLMISKDMEWLAGLEPDQVTQARLAVLMELFFVSGVILAELINLIASFSRNLALFFENQNDALLTVSGGDLESRVAVSTNNEFGFMARHTNKMIQNLKERTDELKLTRDVTIYSLTSLAETRDNETGRHILRTQRYVRVLAQELQGREGFKDYLTDERIDLLYKSAPLHDIGKVGIPDAILLKPGKLDGDEFEIMKKHAEYGKDALERAERQLGTNSFLSLAREIAHAHHEKWDGAGYPRGLKGSDIPISARLMALADVYDALISKRVYKPAFSHEKARAIILEGRGKHFDPAVTDAFLAREEEFKEIAARFMD